MRISRGSVVLVSLDPVRGHEQRGTRPCVVIGDPEAIAHQRFPMLCVVPITGTAGEGVLYPALAPGPSGLAKPSWALLDQLRSIDKRRVMRVFGVVSAAELAAVDRGLLMLLGLGGGLETDR